MTLELTVVTPEGEVFAGRVQGVVLPGSEGQLGVLPGHERFLTPLQIGELEIREAGQSRYAAVSEGFADVSQERVVVLVETCELADRIDRARAERARDRLQRELAELRAGQAEAHRGRVARAALERAVTRIGVARRA